MNVLLDTADSKYRHHNLFALFTVAVADSKYRTRTSTLPSLLPHFGRANLVRVRAHTERDKLFPALVRSFVTHENSVHANIIHSSLARANRGFAIARHMENLGYANTHKSPRRVRATRARDDVSGVLGNEVTENPDEVRSSGTNEEVGEV